MRHGFAKTRERFDRQIKEWGRPAVLRSLAGDRQVTVAIMNYTPQERVGQVLDPVDRKALLSGLAPDGTVLSPPDYTMEQLVTFVMSGDQATSTVDETLTIVQPAARVGSSELVVFWRLQVRK